MPMTKCKIFFESTYDFTGFYSRFRSATIGKALLSCQLFKIFKALSRLLFDVVNRGLKRHRSWVIILNKINGMYELPGGENRL